MPKAPATSKSVPVADGEPTTITDAELAQLGTEIEEVWIQYWDQRAVLEQLICESIEHTWRTQGKPAAHPDALSLAANKLAEHLLASPPPIALTESIRLAAEGRQLEEIRARYVEARRREEPPQSWFADLARTTDELDEALATWTPDQLAAELALLDPVTCPIVAYDLVARAERAGSSHEVISVLQRFTSPTNG